MKTVIRLLIAVFLISGFLAIPDSATAQLFRRFPDRDRDNDRSAEMINGAKSRLPNPTGAISAGNYGPIPQVSDVARAEVQGTVPVRSMPDFEANPDQNVDLEGIPQLFTILRPSWETNGIPVLPPKSRRLRQQDLSMTARPDLTIPGEINDVLPNGSADFVTKVKSPETNSETDIEVNSAELLELLPPLTDNKFTADAKTP